MKACHELVISQHYNGEGHVKLEPPPHQIENVNPIKKKPIHRIPILSGQYVNLLQVVQALKTAIDKAKPQNQNDTRLNKAGVFVMSNVEQQDHWLFSDLCLEIGEGKNNTTVNRNETLHSNVVKTRFI